MPAIVRKGDFCSGHDPGFPSRPNDEGSSDTFVNGLAVHCQGHHWSNHCKGSCHESSLSSGSSSFYINGKQVGRLGDPVACGSVCATGSFDTFCG